MGRVGIEGLAYMLDNTFTVPSDYFVGLAVDTIIAKAAQFSDLTEVSGTGYARQAVSSFAVSTTETDNKKLTLNEFTFTASGTWTAATHWFLLGEDVTSGTFLLLAWDTIDNAPVTLTNGGTIVITPVVVGAG